MRGVALGCLLAGIVLQALGAEATAGATGMATVQEGEVWDGVQRCKDGDSELAKAKKFKEEALRARGLPTEAAGDALYGKECFSDYGEGFHERLSKFWPNPREQLHAGGEAQTADMVAKIGEARFRAHGAQILDVCCGEGATLRKLAKDYPAARFVGIDIVEGAIAAARGACAGLPNVEFVRGTMFDLPFEDASFDVVFGQDPDGFSHPDRLHAFAECHRVLRPGGAFWIGHHWIPAADWSEEELAQYHKEDEVLGWAVGEVGAGRYIECIEKVGFKDAQYSDFGDLAARHFKTTAELMREATGEVPDKWLQKQLRYVESGKRFGLQALATRGT